MKKLLFGLALALSFGATSMAHTIDLEGQVNSQIIPKVTYPYEISVMKSNGNGSFQFILTERGNDTASFINNRLNTLMRQYPHSQGYIVVNNLPLPVPGDDFAIYD